MARPKKKTESELLSEIIIQGIAEKKGKDIVSIDLGTIKSSICDYFIVCHGTSRPHVEAIADSVEKEVRKAVGLKPLHKEGFQNSEWILLDYIDVVVHIFMEKTRDFYQLETLWADAEIKHYEYEE
jgi:ribosome-associated protein